MALQYSSWIIVIFPHNNIWWDFAVTITRNFQWKHKKNVQTTHYRSVIIHKVWRVLLKFLNCKVYYFHLQTLTTRRHYFTTVCLYTFFSVYMEDRLFQNCRCFQQFDSDTLDEWAASFCREFMCAGWNSREAAWLLIFSWHQFDVFRTDRHLTMTWMFFSPTSVKSICWY